MSLADIQQTELDLMVIFDQVMRKHHLKYSLCAGTLLGAARHQGFIPWDDDIDISVPRPDYEELIRLNRQGGLWPSHIQLKCFEDGTLEAPFMKLFDTGTKITEDHYDQKDVTSLWIDIFPVDGLPAEEAKIRRHYRLALFLCKLNVASVVKNGYGSSKGMVILKDLLIKPVARLIGRTRISKFQRKLAMKYPYGDSPKCGMVTWAYDGPGQALTKADYDNLTELSFEGHSFYAIPDWDANLRGIFGDYLTLPPEEERITHNLEAFRL